MRIIVSRLQKNRENTMIWMKRKYRLASIALLSIFLLTVCSKKSPNEASDPTVAVINLTETRQLIRGFGGVNMPGWIDDLTADQVNKAFGTEPGQIGMTILRIRVPYDSTKFSLEVPTAQRATALGATIIASPWTPPAWMKSNNNIVGGRLNDEAYAAYAAHLKSFADYMATNNAPLYAISIQNEPDVTVSYESCDWNATEMVKFIKENAPSIGVKIIAPESYNYSLKISDAILNDPIAAANLSIIGCHIYTMYFSFYTLADKKGKEVWMTEHLVTDTDWWGALFTAKEINDCMSVDMNAYLWWYIRRFYGPIDDNSNVTKRGFVMSQYARFVRPGFYRVNATANPQPQVYVTAYKNSAQVVIVAINFLPPSIEQTFLIHDGSVTSVTPYTTSIDKNCEQGNDITVVNGSFTVTLEEESVTTFVSK
jgi:glucuronoarabinoxylan endo-1,4-beta-xylanase